jgi:prepilin-type N-terminal cleavage/methylation domain-containing protein
VLRDIVRRIRFTRGFSLLEVLVALAILLVAVTALASVSGISARANANAKIATVTSVLAAEKLEQLRALTWGFDAAGTAISDTTTDVTVFPPRPLDGGGLTPSPAGALTQNNIGYCDFLDASGKSLGGAEAAAANAIFVRRWSIDVLPSNPANTLVLQVLVVRVHGGAAGRVRPDEIRLVTAKTRKAL